MAERWRDALNRRGGNVTLVHLSEIGIRGNTHYPMSDMNSLEIADLMSKFLKEEGLDCAVSPLLEQAYRSFEALTGFQPRKASGIILGKRQ